MMKVTKNSHGCDTGTVYKTPNGNCVFVDRVYERVVRYQDSEGVSSPIGWVKQCSVSGDYRHWFFRVKGDETQTWQLADQALWSTLNQLIDAHNKFNRAPKVEDNVPLCELNPVEDNLLESISLNDRVQFQDDETVYVFSNRNADRSDTGGHYWFRPLHGTKGFTLPKPLLAQLIPRITLWARPLPMRKYHVKLLVVCPVDTWVEARSFGEVEAKLGTRYTQRLGDIEVLQEVVCPQ